MADPIDDLSRFREGLEGGDMPLSAAEVRRRGDQIRRRRNALVTGGAALAVAAVAVPVFAIAGGGGVESDRDRTVDDPDRAVTLSQDDLITDEETVYNEGSDWFATDTFAGDGQSPAHPCARTGYEDLGAGAVLQREFELRGTLPDAPAPVDDGSGLNETIAEFATAADARAAYDTVAEWVLGCEGQIPGAERYNITPQARSVDLPEGDAVIYDMWWGPVPEEIDPFGEAAYISETGIVLVGNRLAVLTSVVLGHDYNFLPEEGGTPVNRMVPAAAERLQPDGDAEPQESRPTGSADPVEPSALTTTIPPDFPLVVGWPDMSGNDDYTLNGPDDDRRGLVPSSELVACDRTPQTGEIADRLTARLAGPEDYRARELLVFDGVPAAEAYVASLLDVYGSCSTEGEAPTMTTEVTSGSSGDQSLDIRRSSGTVGATSVQVVRVGNAVLVDLASDARGEGTPLAIESQDRAAEVVAAMDAFLVR